MNNEILITQLDNLRKQIQAACTCLSDKRVIAAAILIGTSLQRIDNIIEKVQDARNTHDRDQAPETAGQKPSQD